MPVKKANPSRLYRSEINRVIGGVCGGLGDFFNVDASLVRLIFVIIALFGGGGILLYLILWLILPSQSSISEINEESIKKNADEIKDKAHEFAKSMKISTHRQNSRTLFGISILILGVIFLLGNFGLWQVFHLGKFWPLILVALGLLVLSRSERQ